MQLITGRGPQNLNLQFLLLFTMPFQTFYVFLQFLLFIIMLLLMNTVNLTAFTVYNNAFAVEVRFVSISLSLFTNKL